MHAAAAWLSNADASDILNVYKRNKGTGVTSESVRQEQFAPIDMLRDRDVFAFGISPWKRSFLRAYFPSTRFRFPPQYLDTKRLQRHWLSEVVFATDPVLLVWGTRLPEEISDFAASRNLPLLYMEDGFIRSLLPSASKTRPVSLTLDSRRPYFDARGASDLETLISTYDFRSDPTLLQRARAAIDLLLESGLSKYNASADAGPLLPRDGFARTVLVVGQVEDDASIRYGHSGAVTNNDLVRLAAQENPGCRILYKPHPDVLRQVRKRGSDPHEVAHLCEILTEPMPLPAVLAAVDHVYTITSLGGFEALMRGLPVTVIGLPFYAGWGLTDDRQPSQRRTRKVTLEELFAAAYLLYPLYFNPVTGERISFETCLRTMSGWMQRGIPQPLLEQLPDIEESRGGFEIWGAYGILGWRKLLTPPVAALIGTIGNREDAKNFRKNPIGFFRNLSNPRWRRIGRFLYPFD